MSSTTFNVFFFTYRFMSFTKIKDILTLSTFVPVANLHNVTDYCPGQSLLCEHFTCVNYVNFCTGLIFFFLNNLWLDDLRAEQKGDRLNIALSRDVILCG